MSAQSSMVRIMFMSAVLLMLAVSVGSAQGMRMSPENQAAMLKDSLGLDSVQTVKITAVLKDLQGEVMSIMQSGGDDREAMRAQMQEARKKYEPKIEALLTDAQKKRYEEVKKNRPAGRMRPRN